jgi:hypothetical protein
MSSVSTLRFGPGVVDAAGGQSESPLEVIQATPLLFALCRAGIGEKGVKATGAEVLARYFLRFSLILSF